MKSGENGAVAAALAAIPPLAGLATYEEAARVGYSVDENVERLRRFNYVETRLHQIALAFMNPTPEWEVKGAFSLHLWLDAEHSQVLRDNLRVMDAAAIDLCKSAKLPILVFNFKREGNIERAIAGHPIGTLVSD